LDWFKSSFGKELPVYQVLIVCTGNTCRSPMAEGILRRLLEEQGAQLIVVKSAGTSALLGMPASFVAISIMRQYGIDIISHRSQPLSRRLLDKSDLILVMAENHLEVIKKKFPQYLEKVFLLKNFSRIEPVEDPNITDPIGGELELFQEVYEDIYRELERITPTIINASMEKI
jgi:protein-tyrosine-phosphatase